MRVLSLEISTLEISRRRAAMAPTTGTGGPAPPTPGVASPSEPGWRASPLLSLHLAQPSPLPSLHLCLAFTFAQPSHLPSLPICLDFTFA